jgi:Flp pilus assembly pilin Flp
MPPVLNDLQSHLQRLVAFLQRTEGQGLAEYGMLVSAIAIVVVVAAALFGHQVSSMFSHVADNI